LSMGIAGLMFLVPFGIVLLTAVKNQGDLVAVGVLALPEKIMWSNFIEAWEIGKFGTYFRNSLILIVTKVPLGILLASLAAYPLAKIKFRLGMPLFVFFLLGLAVPIHVTLLPLVILLRKLGVVNTVWALIPPYVAFGLPFQIFVMRGFFRLIPNELVEAARMDGASELWIFARVMLPLAMPAVVTLFIIDAVHTWNELLIALVLISSDAYRTVPVGLLRFQGQFSSMYTHLMAGVLIAITPIIVLYVGLQRYLVSGLSGGALKD